MLLLGPAAQLRPSRMSRRNKNAGDSTVVVARLSLSWGRLMLVAAAVGSSSYLLLRALGRVKLLGGKKKPMGVDCSHPPDANRNKAGARRLGFLERWYVAHSRAGMHTGFVVGMEVRLPHPLSAPCRSWWW